MPKESGDLLTDHAGDTGNPGSNNQGSQRGRTGVAKAPASPETTSAASLMPASYQPFPALGQSARPRLLYS